MVEPLQWLTCEGEDWQRAVDEASSHLLQEYRTKCREDSFVNLYQLAAILSARIALVTELSDGARLLPVQGGFRVLVSDKLPAGRFRFSVAHELAHTLFYVKDGEIPRRAQAPSNTEEIFCFDVARRVLAPRWLIDGCKLRELRSGKAVFAKLIDRNGPFRLSRPLAARVMLGDYRLAKGVAGTWIEQDGTWKLKPGMAYATQGMSERQRKLLRAMALFWLKNRREPAGFQVIGSDNSPGQGSFVVVLQE